MTVPSRNKKYRHEGQLEEDGNSPDPCGNRGDFRHTASLEPLLHARAFPSGARGRWVGEGGCENSLLGRLDIRSRSGVVRAGEKNSERKSGSEENAANVFHESPLRKCAQDHHGPEKWENSRSSRVTCKELI